MRCISCSVVSIAALVLAAVPVCAQNAWSFEARSFGMGNAVVAVADDSAAWLQNPAGLPNLMVREGSRSSWPGRLSATTDLGADADTIGINYSARSSEGGEGWGTGYWELGSYRLGPTISLSIDRIGAGYGSVFKPGWSWGVSVTRLDMSWDVSGMVQPAQAQQAMAAYSGSEIIVDIGLMHDRALPRGQARFGFIARDVLDNMQSTFDLGASLRTQEGLLLAGEVRDAGDDVERMLNVGAEWRLPRSPEWTVLAGLADGDLTYGAGYDFGRWAVYLSRQHLAHDDVTALTLCGYF